MLRESASRTYVRSSDMRSAEADCLSKVLIGISRRKSLSLGREERCPCHPATDEQSVSHPHFRSALLSTSRAGRSSSAPTVFGRKLLERRQVPLLPGPCFRLALHLRWPAGLSKWHSSIPGAFDPRKGSFYLRSLDFASRLRTLPPHKAFGFVC